jgi:hypothetical protein
MHTTQQILDLAKSNSGLASDYKLGVVLGVTTSALSNYRHNRSSPDDSIGSKLAELAGLDGGYVLACLHAERSRDDQTRSLWRSVASRLAKTGATAAVASLFVGGTPDGMAKAGIDISGEPVIPSGSVYYVK